MNWAAGGCACGRYRYGVRGAPTDTGFCHCRLCQRSSGAPVMAYASFSGENFRWEAAPPTVFASSEKGRRHFCEACGTQIAFTDTELPDEISINTATMDDPTYAPPSKHIYEESRIPWLIMNDGLPRRPQG